MKNLRISFLSLMVSLLVIFSSCKKDDNKPTGEFATGVFVVNEGNFGSGDGTVSYYNTSANTTELDVFGLKNSNKALGDVVQSMSVDSDKGYIVVNGDGKLFTVNANTMELIHTMTGLSLPRYFIVYQGKGYLTEWVSYSDPGQVLVINLDKSSVEDTIKVGYGAENLIAFNNKIYVSNNFESTISVIDPAQKKVTKTISVSSSPGQLVVDKNNKLWVICGGGYDANFAPLNDGRLYEIDPTSDAVLASPAFNQTLPAKLAINKAGDKLYFFGNTAVYSASITGSVASAPWVTESTAIGFYGIGVDPNTDEVYVGDAKGFAAGGVTFRYDANGTALGTFPTGRGPSGFVFKK